MNKKEMYGYAIAIDKHLDYSERTGGEFGSWSAGTSHAISRFAFPELEFPDASAPFKLESGERAYAVWVVWGDGDSFGHHSGAGSEVVGLFKDPTAAFELKTSIEELDRGERGYHFKTRDGQEFICRRAPWQGHFESLDSVHVDEVTFVDHKQ